MEKEKKTDTKAMTMMEKIVSLTKQRGFVYPSSEIYGGFAATYDFGSARILIKEEY